MKDERALAYINLFAILGSLPYLCELDRKSARMIENADISIGFAVKDGPSATLFFEKGKCRMEPGADDCQVRLPFASCKKFNGLIDGTVTPIPTKGFTKVGFLLKTFKRLTDRLTEFLRPAPGALDNPAFFRISTTLMLHVITEAAAQLGNEDSIGQCSAASIVNGTAKLSIKDGPSTGLCCRNHRLRALHSEPEQLMSYMEFEDMRVARDLFDGNINAIAAVGLGQVRIGGMISQIDNINRILDRVTVYLA